MRSSLKSCLLPQHMRQGVAEGRFFVGLHERYNESLALMATWLGWEVRGSARALSGSS